MRPTAPRERGTVRDEHGRQMAPPSRRAGRPPLAPRIPLVLLLQALSTPSAAGRPGGYGRQAPVRADHDRVEALIEDIVQNMASPTSNLCRCLRLLAGRLSD